ncbi:histone chaperone ASF1-like [Papaver somniferum]|uniref:histone chaperone ASF1-like n=1 Tax=Papaver somniferum TaxID=3469 RepID=UPI000E6FA422|nr:histone chaperone ASF1-like [Papaver somniferum]
MVTPPSRTPRNGKYLNVGLLRGKTPSEVSLIIREPRDPCDESSASSSPVVSATGSDEEEVAEHEEIPLGGEYAAYDDDDDDDDGNGNGGNGGNEEADIEEEEDEEGDEDDGNYGNGNERNDGDSGDEEEEEEEIQEVEEDAAQPQPKKKVPIAPSARHIPPQAFSAYSS